MDISFHYFAIKVIAKAAGYGEEAAQRVAEYSQYIDDFNIFRYLKADDIPEYIKTNPDQDIIINEMLRLVNPVTTGFFDYQDYIFLLTDRNQKFVVTPFHFMPQTKQEALSMKYRTKPAIMGDGSIISDLLLELQQSILSGVNDDALLRMGMLLHVFADTHAHQLFSGYHDACNDVEVRTVINNSTGKNETQQYTASKLLPTIGHGTIGHIPDLTNLSFAIIYTDEGGREKEYNRNNTEEFVEVGKAIYEYMRRCLGKEVEEDIWEETAQKLTTAFLIDISAELDVSGHAAYQKLLNKWGQIFTDCSFCYSREDIEGRYKEVLTDSYKIMHEGGMEMKIVDKTYSNDFYQYNYFADEILVTLYGKQPRYFF